MLLCCLLVAPLRSNAQSTNFLDVSVGFLQLKDGFNQCMLFNGPQLDIRYEKKWILSDYELNYHPKIALGVPFCKEMAALAIGISPIDVSCVRNIYKNKIHSVKAGLNVATNYNYQLYPYLQNGYLFWQTEIGLSLCLQYLFRWQNKQLKVHVQNSVLGFTSHPKEYDPYFYSIKFEDFIRFAHQDMKFGSFNDYNHTQVAIEFNPNLSRRHIFAAAVDYLSIYYGVRFQRLNYYLQWKIAL